MTLPREEVVAGLLDELGRFEALVRSLDATEWQAPSRCGGWSAGDVAAHVIGQLATSPGAASTGLGTPEVTARQVEERRGRTPVELADELAAATGVAAAILDTFDDAAWAGPGPAGGSTLGDGVEALWFDASLHADDIRDAVGRESELGSGVKVAVSHLAQVLTDQGYAPATLALDGLDAFPVSGGGPAITGLRRPFVLVATGPGGTRAARPRRDDQRLPLSRSTAIAPRGRIRAMPFDIADYKRRAGPIVFDDLDLSHFERHPLDAVGAPLHRRDARRRVPHRLLPARPARDARARRSRDHRVPDLLEPRGALARRGARCGAWSRTVAWRRRARRVPPSRPRCPRPDAADDLARRVHARGRGLRRAPHGLGRDQRVVRAGELRAAGAARRRPGAHRAVAPDHAPGGPPPGLLRVGGGEAARGQSAARGGSPAGRCGRSGPRSGRGSSRRRRCGSSRATCSAAIRASRPCAASTAGSSGSRAWTTSGSSRTRSRRSPPDRPSAGPFVPEVVTMTGSGTDRAALNESGGDSGRRSVWSRAAVGPRAPARLRQSSSRLGARGDRRSRVRGEARDHLTPPGGGPRR